MKAMMVGDTHGNIGWLKNYIYPVAMTVGADLVVVLGDFGAWEHTRAGAVFLNECEELAASSGIDLYWLHGNHDKYSHTLATYGDDRDASGFIRCREHVLYIPQGHTWNWGGQNYRSFGGAYSIDKGWRLNTEKERYAQALKQARSKVGEGDLFAAETVPSTEGTLWFPEEEMTDDEMEQLLHDDWHPKDVVLSHDKPLSVRIPWSRKNFPACVPNQIRLDRALKAHKPRWWFHGHFHYFYRDTVYGPDFATQVVGLDADASSRDYMNWKRDNTWLTVETEPGSEPLVKIGSELGLTNADLLAKKIELHIATDH